MKKLLVASFAALVLGAVAPVASHALAGASDPAASSAPTVSKDLAATLASSSTTGLTVLVRGATREAALDAVASSHLHLVDVLDTVNVAVAVGTPAQVRAVTARPGVEYVERDRPLRLFGDDTADVATRTAEARAADSPVLKTSTTTDRRGDGLGNGGVGQGRGAGNAAGTVTTTEGAYTGAGESIAIVDSGVDGTHPMFTDPETGASKVVVNMKLACTNDGPFVLPDACPTGADVDPFFVDFTPVNDTDTPSLGGHGTHVAGIAAGFPVTTSDGRTLMGTAPGAKIVSLSIGQALSIYGSDAALDWILRHHADPCGDGSCPPITVVNNSYGGGTEFDPNSTTTVLQDALVDAGVVMVWANGNGDTTNDGGDGSDNRSSSDSMDPKRGSISVANYDDHETGTREGTIDPSSSRGNAKKPATWPDVSAPGTNITSSCRPYLAVCEGATSPDPNYGTISGTSMATPHVVGIVALLREADPSLTPAQVQDVIENTAHKFQSGAPYWMLTNPKYGNTASSSSFDKGHGLIDTTAALASILDRTAAAPVICSANDPGIVDSEGDATSVLGSSTPLPSEPSLDILSGGVAWDATAKELALSIHVKDLTDTDPPGSTGIVYDITFTYGGTEYTLNATRSTLTGESAELQVLAPTRTTVAPATVTFDADTDTITAVLADADLGSVKPFETGDVLSGFNVVSRREEAFVIPDVDTANGSCPYTIGGSTGGGTTTIPEPQPFPEDEAPPSSVDATLADGQSFQADVTTTGATDTGTPGVDGYTCAGPDDPQCFTFRVAVTPGGASSNLNVWLDPTVDQAALEDWDVHVYDAGGNEVGDSDVPTNAGPQTILEVDGANVAVTEPGVYAIVVDPYFVPSGSTMTVHADLTAG